METELPPDLAALMEAINREYPEAVVGFLRWFNGLSNEKKVLAAHMWKEMESGNFRLTLATAHGVAVQRFLGFVGGSLAGLVPLVEFAIQSNAGRHLVLPSVPLSLLFVLVGTAVTVLLTGAALAAFHEAHAISTGLGDLLEGNRVALPWWSLGGTVRWLRRSASPRIVSALSWLAWVLVLFLVVWIDWTLPWPW